MKCTLKRFIVFLRVLLGGMRLWNEVYFEEVYCILKSTIGRNGVIFGEYDCSLKSLIESNEALE